MCGSYKDGPHRVRPPKSWFLQRGGPRCDGAAAGGAGFQGPGFWPLHHEVQGWRHSWWHHRWPHMLIRRCSNNQINVFVRVPQQHETSRTVWICWFHPGCRLQGSWKIQSCSSMEMRPWAPGGRVASATILWPSREKWRKPASSSSRSEVKRAAVCTYHKTTNFSEIQLIL